jgi:glycosyltransferase involved in cell wall biosynthesis
MMRIGLMLRAYDEKGGIGVYTRNLVEELLRLDRKNHYVLFYRGHGHVGRFAQYANVSERRVPGKSNLYWDQVAMPYHCRREQVDVLLHPKFTAPLLAPCKTIMVVHGADWLLPEQARYYTRADVAQMRLLLPLYFRKCATVISVSQLTSDNFSRCLRLPPGKIRTVYFGPARHFRRVTDEAALSRVKTRYNLPDHFIFTLTKRLGDGRKNLAGVFNGYAAYHASVDDPAKLVVGGADCHLFRDEYALPAGGYGRDIHFAGWLDQEDLPAVYSLADLYLYPSNLEAFPIPLTEAMACGTPIVTSNVNGLQEIAGDAALLVDPADDRAIGEAVHRALNDTQLRQSLIARGLARAHCFSWERCAAQILTILEGSAPAL